MATVVESSIEFTYNPPCSFTKFDGAGRNTIWKGVDFIIDEWDRWLWLEIKNFRYGRFRNKRLTDARRTRLNSDLFQKFLGTTTYLAHKGDFICKPLFFAVILEVPEPDFDLKYHANDFLRRCIRPPRALEKQY